MQLFHSDRFEFPLPPGHRFPVAKYRMLRERVEPLAAAAGAPLHEAPAATREELQLVHDADYVDAFCAGALDAQHVKRIGLPWSPELVERALRSCGGTVAAVRHALRARSGAAVNLSGGTHHARAAAGAGYCVFNDAAVGARVAQREHGVQRVLVVDTDVHQGDGTAAIFDGDPSVFTFSIHGAQNFPAAKAASDLDVALPDGAGDDAFLAALADGMRQAFAAARPGLVVYVSGADAHERDRLGRLAVSAAALAERDDMVFAACRAAGARVVTVMAGGYGRVLDETVDVHVATVRAALRHFPA